MGITFNGMEFKLNLNKLLPSPEEHDIIYTRTTCENISSQIRSVMRMNGREVFLYNLPTEIQTSLIQNGFHILRTSNKNLEEYKVTW